MVGDKPRSVWLAPGMDRQAVRAAYDEQIRRGPVAELAGERVERDAAVIRFVGRAGGWSAVTWSALTEADADAAIAATIDRFAVLDVAEWEWKHYSYDTPADLTQRLLAAGLAAEPAESLMVGEIAELALDVPPPRGVELRQVTDRQGVDALVRVHEEVFGEDHAALGAELVARLALRPPTVAAVIAMAGDTPVCAGRVELHPGTDFASLWGGGTLAAWRGRGVFRALVAHRAALAVGQGLSLPAGRRLAGEPADPPAPRLRRARRHDAVPPPRLRGVEPSLESAGLRAGRGSSPATLPPPTHEGSTHAMTSVLHVATTGSDTRRRLRGPARSGRSTAPPPLAQPGDTVVVHEGEYREWVTPRARRAQRPAAHHLRGGRRASTSSSRGRSG